MAHFENKYQVESMDCGPTCLCMIAKHYGKTFPLVRHFVGFISRMASKVKNRRMPKGTYGGVSGRKTKVGRKLLRFPPTRL